MNNTVRYFVYKVLSTAHHRNCIRKTICKNNEIKEL